MADRPRLNRGGTRVVKNHRPSHEERRDLELIEYPPTPEEQRTFLGVKDGMSNSYLRCYSVGECRVFVTREGGRYHLSISHPRRYPTWEEVSRVWYRAVPGAKAMCGAMPLPPERDYLNIHNFCLHVYECRDPGFVGQMGSKAG